MSDTRYWRIREEIEDVFKERSQIPYRELIEKMNPSEAFYAGIVVSELFSRGKLSWDAKRDLHSSKHLRTRRYCPLCSGDAEQCDECGAWSCLACGNTWSPGIATVTSVDSGTELRTGE